MEYKVVSEEGVTIDGLDFIAGDIVDLDPGDFNMPELLSSGAVVENRGEIEEEEEE